MDMSDWRKILIAYIRHIKLCEGDTYIPGHTRLSVDSTALEDLTDMERESLDAAAREVKDD